LPAAPNATYSYAAGTSLKIKISDLTSDTVASLGSGSQSATITMNSSYIFYQPQSGNANNDAFTYTTSNGNCSNTGTLTILAMRPGGLAQSISWAAGGVSVTFAGIPGLGYDVQRADDANFTVNVTTLLTTNAPAAGIFTITDSSPSNPTGYYRTRQN
jgi:hypothetical protein